MIDFLKGRVLNVKTKIEHVIITIPSFPSKRRFHDSPILVTRQCSYLKNGAESRLPMTFLRKAPACEANLTGGNPSF